MTIPSFGGILYIKNNYLTGKRIMAKLTKSFFENGESREAVRINKYLSDSGMCSRREADRLVEEGKVLIDGVPAVMGSKVLMGQKVTIAGKTIEKEEKMVLIAFNKPQGVVCTTDRREPDNIIDFINYGSRIFPIGRLDKDSEGLILLTNDGEIVNKILRAGNHHEKEYLVTVNKPVTPEFLKGMAGGVPILDTVTKPCIVEALDKRSFRIVLTQGLNRQIRRMCEYFEYLVMSLKRIRIMNVNLGRLQLGGYRNLTEWELEELNLLIQDSSNGPADEIDEEFLPAEGVVMGETIAKATARKLYSHKDSGSIKRSGKQDTAVNVKRDNAAADNRKKPVQGKKFIKGEGWTEKRPTNKPVFESKDTGKKGVTKAYVGKTNAEKTFVEKQFSGKQSSGKNYGGKPIAGKGFNGKANTGRPKTFGKKK